jgi:hypothetical protein
MASALGVVVSTGLAGGVGGEAPSLFVRVAIDVVGLGQDGKSSLGIAMKRAGC